MRTDRIRDALRRLSAVGLSVVACACLVVFAGHKSEHPSLLGWSGRYLIAAVLPVLGYVLAQGVLVFYPPLAVHRERYVAVGCLLVGVLVSALGVLTWPSYVGPILAVSLGLFAVPLAAYRASRTSEWLLSHVTLIVLCLVLVLPDVGGSILEGRRLADPRLPRWTDQFRHRWPDAEPFIAAEGRPSQSRSRVYTDDLGRPPYHMKTNSEDSERPRIPWCETRRAESPQSRHSFSVGYGVTRTAIGSILSRVAPGLGREVSFMVRRSRITPTVCFMQRCKIRCSGFPLRACRQRRPPGLSADRGEGIFSLDSERVHRTPSNVPSRIGESTRLRRSSPGTSTLGQASRGPDSALESQITSSGG